MSVRTVEQGEESFGDVFNSPHDSILGQVQNMHKEDEEFFGLVDFPAESPPPQQHSSTANN